MKRRIGKNLVKRIQKIESQTTDPRWLLVIKDLDGLYHGDCGDKLSKTQFLSWFKTQDRFTQVIIVSVDCNSEETTFKVDNALFHNTGDILKLLKILENVEQETGLCNRCHQPLPKYTERGDASNI